jgi:hypothetical protein
MALPARLKCGIFMAPFHWLSENPTLSLERDMELLEWLYHLGFDEAWIGEYHSFMRRANRLKVYPAIADFLRRHLPPA